MSSKLHAAIVDTLKTPRTVKGWPYALTVLLGAVLFLLPALYNGYPLVNSDDGTYIWSGFRMQQPGDRPITYGLFLRFFSLNGVSFWIPAFVQALIISWLIVKLIQRLVGGRRLFANALTVFIVLSLTSLSWTVSEIIPDIWTGIALLSAVLIFLNRETRLVKFFLLLIYFCAVATHLSNILIFTGVFLVLMLAKSFVKDEMIRKGFWINILLLLGASWLTVPVIGRASQKSQHVFLMASMLEKGVLKKYLDENCDQKNYQLCRFKESLPTDPNVFIWDQNSPLYQQGGWDATKEDYDLILHDIYTSPKYLFLFLQKSLEGAWRQIFECHLAEGNYPFPAGTHVDAAVQESAPGDTTMYRNAWQQQHNIVERIDAMNNINYVVLIGAALLLLYVWIKGKLRGTPALISGMLTSGYLFNVLVCATFAQVNARYGSRLSWVFPLAFLLCWFYGSTKRKNNEQSITAQ